MPKVSKIGRSSPGDAAPVKAEPEQYACTRCGRTYRHQRGNFLLSHSPIYRENNDFTTVCKKCVEEMFQFYVTALGDYRAAMRRICMKFDIYWSDKMYVAAYKSFSAGGSRSFPNTYTSKLNLMHVQDKTFDDTLDEEKWLGASAKVDDLAQELGESGDDVNVPDDIIDFWGSGLAPSFYFELERRLKYWCGDRDRSELDVGEMAVIKQICILEATINRDAADGKPIEKSVNALNNLLGSANLKPIQKKADEAKAAEKAAEAKAASELERTPFGVWIKRWEDSEPVPEPDPELQDVDGIVRYISIWFLGHLCKMLGIKNTYCKLYEDEIAKMRVDRPEYEEEDDETLFNDIFGSDDGDGESP